MPAEPATIATYLAHLADSGRKASTIARRTAAIAYAHRLKGLDPPTAAEPVRAVNRGIRRRIGTAVTKKAPAIARLIGAMLAHTPNTLIGWRDRALLLMGFACALRRSELVALQVEDLELHPEGMLVNIRASKTDQEQKGYAIAVPRGTRLKPIEAIEKWIKVSGISRGPIFRRIDRHRNIGASALTAKTVADIVKRYAQAAGVDAKQFAGHSLRAGFVTSALSDGADILRVMDVTRHKRVETLREYDRREKAFRDHAGEGFL